MGWPLTGIYRMLFFHDQWPHILPFSMTTVDPMPTQSMFVPNSISYAMLAFHFYEWICDLHFELAHIWRKPLSSIVKWQYIGSRYIGLILQIVNSVFYMSLDLSNPPSLESCRKAHSVRIVLCETLLFSLNGSLVHRLIALYNRPRMAALFISGIILEFLSATLLGLWVAYQMDMQGPCMSYSIPRQGVFLSVVHLMVQATIWGFTVFKFGTVKAPVLTLVLRDGSYVFGVMLASLAASLVTVVAKFELVHCTYTIFAAIVTSANCRIIRNMEAMGKEESDRTTEIQFTSVVPGVSN